MCGWLAGTQVAAGASADKGSVGAESRWHISQWSLKDVACLLLFEGVSPESDDMYRAKGDAVVNLSSLGTSCHSIK